MQVNISKKGTLKIKFLHASTYLCLLAQTKRRSVTLCTVGQSKVLLSVHAHFAVLDLILLIVNQHTYFGCQEISGTGDVRKDPIKFLTFTVILTLKTICFLRKTLQLMMTYHPIKFGCRKVSSSADMVETVISDHMSPQCDP